MYVLDNYFSKKKEIIYTVFTLFFFVLFNQFEVFKGAKAGFIENSIFENGYIFIPLVFSIKYFLSDNKFSISEYLDVYACVLLLFVKMEYLNAVLYIYLFLSLISSLYSNEDIRKVKYKILFSCLVLIYINIIDKFLYLEFNSLIPVYGIEKIINIIFALIFLIVLVKASRARFYYMTNIFILALALFNSFISREILVDTYLNYFSLGVLFISSFHLIKDINSRLLLCVALAILVGKIYLLYIALFLIVYKGLIFELRSFLEKKYKKMININLTVLLFIMTTLMANNFNEKQIYVVLIFNFAIGLIFYKQIKNYFMFYRQVFWQKLLISFILGLITGFIVYKAELVKTENLIIDSVLVMFVTYLVIFYNVLKKKVRAKPVVVKNHVKYIPKKENDAGFYIYHFLYKVFNIWTLLVNKIIVQHIVFIISIIFFGVIIFR
jgi:hypothetical protein